MRFHTLLKTVPLLLILCSFTEVYRRDDYKAYHLSGYAQGTTYSIIYYSRNESVKNIQIDSILDNIDQSMSLYKQNTLISQFNASPRGIRLDAHFKKVIQKSFEIYKASKGYFDITIAPLVQAWGFGPVKAEAMPSKASIIQAKKHIGSDKLLLKGDSLLKTDPEVKIDVNGIAQGYSVDVLADFLESRGIANYLVELGGELRVKGKKLPGAEPFHIGIESPSDNLTEGPVRKILQIPEGAITTSGSYKKFYTADQKRISHLIDPRTGYPFQNDMISVTVYAKDAITADGYDNVLMGMGIKKSLKFLKSRRNMEAYFIYQKKDGTIADTASAGFYKFISTKKELK